MKINEIIAEAGLSGRLELNEPPATDGDIIGMRGNRLELQLPDGSIKLLDPAKIEAGAHITQGPSKGAADKVMFVRYIDTDTVEVAVSGPNRPRTLMQVPLSAIKPPEEQVQ